MRRFALFFALLATAAFAHSGTNTWSRLGPDGGLINAVTFTRTAQTVLVSAANGLYRSTDGGVSWKPVKTDFENAPADIAVDPADPARLYAVTSTWPSLYQSNDGGESWGRVHTLPTAVVTATDIAVGSDGRTIYVNSMATLFRSLDRGESWSQRANFDTGFTDRITRLAIDPADAKLLYAIVTASGAPQRIMRTQDGGQSWQTLLSLSSATYAYDLAVSEADPSVLWLARADGVWKSADRGANWSRVYSGRAITAVTPAPGNAGIAFAGAAYGEILRTTDSGASWTDVTGSIAADQVLTIAVDPSQNSRVLVGGTAGLYGSLDSGATWSPRVMGINSARVDSISSDPAADRVYVNVAGQGLYFAERGAESLKATNNQALRELDNSGPLQPTPRLYVVSALAQAGRLFASLTPGLATSTDGGTTWARSAPAPSGSQQLFDMASSRKRPRTLLVAGYTSFLRSADGGALWTLPTSGLPASRRVVRAMFSDSAPDIAYAELVEPPAGAGRELPLGIYRSSDAGVTWVPASTSPAYLQVSLLAVDPVDSQTLYGSSDSNLLRSSDGGRTWSPIPWDLSRPDGGGFRLVVDPINPQILFASKGVAIGRSVDRGATWESLPGDIERHLGMAGQLFLDPVRPESLYVATDRNGLRKITIAPDLWVTGAGHNGSNAVPQGQPLQFTFTARHRGYEPTGTTLRVNWSGPMRILTATMPGTTCVSTPTSVTCTIPRSKSGTPSVLSLTTEATALGAIDMTATVSSDQPDALMDDNTTHIHAVVMPMTALSMTARGTPTASTGDALTYNFTVTNSGPDAATGVAFYFKAASGMTRATGESPAGSCNLPSSLDVGCNLGVIQKGASVQVTVTGIASSAGLLVSSGSVTTDRFELNPDNNGSSVSTQVSAPPASGGDAPSSGGGGALSGLDLLTLLLAMTTLRLRSISTRCKSPTIWR